MSPPQRRPPAPRELMDEILGEILLRIPPEEPADLVRAALVCKPWLRVLSDPAFRRGYRERYGRPPLLGFVHNLDKTPGFVPTVASRCCSFRVPDCAWALDSRHGRVLVHRLGLGLSDLVVWDPITGDQQHLPVPPYSHAYYAGAVMCAAASCDHLDCSSGPFLVVFVGTDDEENITWASRYSSETGVWSAMATADFSASTMVDLDSYIETKPSIMIGNALYFVVELGKAILKYDLVGQSLSVIDAPQVSEHMGIVMPVDDGGLGFAAIEGDDLHVWSWLTDNSSGWTLHKVIQLHNLLPARTKSIPSELIGFAEGANTIFLEAETGVFTLEIKSEKIKKIGERGDYYAVLPYMSFCSPVLGAKYR